MTESTVATASAAHTVSLREAKRIISSIDQELYDLRNEMSTYFNPNRTALGNDFHLSANAVSAGEAFVKSNLQVMERLNAIRQYLRNEIGRANITSGINVEVEAIAYLESVRHMVTNLRNLPEPTLRREPPVFAGVSSNPELQIKYTPGVSADFKTAAKERCRKINFEIQTHKDKCAYLNGQYKITIPADYMVDLEAKSLVSK